MFIRPASHRLAVAALLLAGASASAQTPAPATSQVTIYGFLAPMLDTARVSGAASVAPAVGVRPSQLGAGAYNGNGNGRNTVMQSSISNFGLRGTEDLGGGLSAFFQMEHGFSVGTGAVTGPPGSARFWNRNTAVGLRGAFGSVLMGIWDSPMAWSHLGLTSGVRNPYAGDSSQLFVSPGFNIAHTATIDNRGNNPTDAVFNRRQGNSIQYWSPGFSGFSFRLAYALSGGAKTAANGASHSPTVLGLGTEYTSGPLLLRYAYQQHRDYFGLAWLGAGSSAANPDTPGSTANDSRDAAHRVIARWSFSPQWSVQASFDRHRFAVSNVAAGAVQRFERDAWALLAVHRNAPHTFWANLGQAGDGECARAGSAACISSDLGATAWNVGWRYDLSRRTDLFAAVYGVRNEDNGQYGVFPRPFVGIAPGARTNAFTLGIEHSF